MGEKEGQEPEEAASVVVDTNESLNRPLERILDSSVELPPDEEMQAVLKRLNTKAENYQYGEILDETGEGCIAETLSVKTENYSYDLVYGYIDEGSKADTEIQEYVDAMSYVEREFHDFKSHHYWRQLTSMTLQAGSNGNSQNIFEMMPEEYKIFFADSKTFINAAVDPLLKNIYITGGSLAAPITIISLLHEIGHTWDDHNIKTGKTASLKDGRSDGDLMEKMRQERAASSFELGIVRSITKPGDQLRKDALAEIKYLSLETYRQSIRADVSKRESNEQLGREMSKDIRETTEEEELEDYKWNDFLVWQNTKEYDDWMALDQNKSLKMEDVFWAWQKWCEENGRDWWNSESNKPSA